MQSDNKSIFSILEDDFKKTAEKEFNLWLNQNAEYRKNIKKMNKLLGLKNDNRFESKFTASFWTGKRSHRPKTIIVSLNPGYNSERAKGLSKRNKQVKDWKTHCRRHDNGFAKLGEARTKEKQRHSPFFRVWYALFSGLYDKKGMTIKSDNYDFFDKNILSLNLFPFHSNKSSEFKRRFPPKILALVIPHVSNLLEFINKKNPKDVCIFNGKVWDTLLFTHGLIPKSQKGYKKVRLVKAKNGTIYHIKFFKYRNVKCVLFTKFLSSLGRESMTDKRIRKHVANKIKRQYPEADWVARQ